MDSSNAIEDALIHTMTADVTYQYFFNISKTEETATCKMCGQSFTFNSKTTGTSTIMRHVMNKHRKVHDARENAKKIKPSGQLTLLNTGFSLEGNANRISNMDPIKRCVLTLCCCQHPLPLQFFEDPVIASGFRLPTINRKKLREEIQEIAHDLRSTLLEDSRTRWATIALDGWKNPVTKHKRLSVILFFCHNPSVPIFFKSFMLENGSASSIKNYVVECINFLETYKIKVIAGVTDNARNMTCATDQIFEEKNSVLPLQCSAHTVNLIIRDALNNIPFLNDSLKILGEYVAAEKVKRYCETRWNSVFDKYNELLAYVKKMSLKS